MGAERIETRSRNAQETKLRILACAEAEFASKGFDGARLGNIARAAGVQQALIHHYFVDKAGLYRGVVEHALSAISLEGWNVLQRLAQPIESVKVEEIVEAFYDLLMAFSLEHGKVLAILRHAASAEARNESVGEGTDVDDLVRSVLREKARPVFEAVVALIEQLQALGKVNADVHPRQLGISAIAMIWMVIQDEAVVKGLWPTEVRSPSFLQERKKEVVATILARLKGKRR